MSGMLLAYDKSPCLRDSQVPGRKPAPGKNMFPISVCGSPEYYLTGARGCRNSQAYIM